MTKSYFKWLRLGAYCLASFPLFVHAQFSSPSPPYVSSELNKEGRNPERDPLQANVGNGPALNLSPRAGEILNFWFGFLPDPVFFPADKVAVWVKANSEITRQIRERFVGDLLKAREGEYNHWRENPRGRLALILLLDQFSRSIYHHQPQQFLSDPMARGLVLEGMERQHDQYLYPIERAFFYLPLEHAESLPMQNLSVQAYRRLLLDSPPPLKRHMDAFLQSAIHHRQQVARFGRFPHRNALLKRESTPEEAIFLSQWRGTPPF